MIIYDTDILEFIEKKVRHEIAKNHTNSLSTQDIEQILELLQRANITDEKIRAEHVEQVKRIKQFS